MLGDSSLRATTLPALSHMVTPAPVKVPRELAVARIWMLALVSVVEPPSAPQEILLALLPLVVKLWVPLS